MAKKTHLILLALLCLQLISAVNRPQTTQPGDPENAELIPPVSTDSAAETNQFAVPASSGCAAQIIPVQNEDYEQRLVELVNTERAAVGLAPLKRNDALSNASRYHANDMMVDVYFQHDSYDIVNGSLTIVCGVWTRVKNFYSYDLAAGENIAAGQDTPDQVMSAWMASDGHRANILSANFRELGVGYYHGGSWFGDFWVQDFGTRSSVYPVVINLENSQTSSRDVSLYLYGKGVFSEFRVKDDASTWSAWQPFQEQVNWTLAGAGNQVRTVTVEMRKSNGEVSSSSDTIYLYGNPSLGNLPDGVRFLYIKSSTSLSAANNTLQPLNVGTADVLDWSLSVSGNWISLSTNSGSTPGTQVSISPRNVNILAPGTYTGSLTFTVTSPASVSGSPTTIPVTLIVVDNLDKSIFLPAILR